MNERERTAEAMCRKYLYAAGASLGVMLPSGTKSAL
jgi:hypothetical protein